MASGAHHPSSSAARRGLRNSDSRLNVVQANAASAAAAAANVAAASAAAAATAAAAVSQKSIPTILSRKRKSEIDDNQEMPYRPSDCDADCLIIPSENRPPVNNRVQNSTQPFASSSSSRVPFGTLHSSSSSNVARAAETTLHQTWPPPPQNRSSDQQKTNARKQHVQPFLEPRMFVSSPVDLDLGDDDDADEISFGASSSPATSPSRRRASLAATAKEQQLLPPPQKKFRMRTSWSQFREFVTSGASSPPAVESVSVRSRGSAPFPTLAWADREEMWELICAKEHGMYRRAHSGDVLERHPALQPRMRAILLDWLIEVCEVYRLHRETFYLAVDFIDRYLSKAENVPKTRLQLIGVSSLFIGSKIEEIYPPKLSEFAYVTDGACTEEEILSMELVILKSLNWGLTPQTTHAWAKLYVQVLASDRHSLDTEEGFVMPRYSGLDFSRLMQLLDLCTLDLGSLNFRYSILAASAIYHFHDERVAKEASGYSWSDISGCVAWMSAFAFALREQSPLQPRSFHNLSPEQQHNVQTHTVELSLLDRAQQRLELLSSASSRDSPDPSSAAHEMAAADAQAGALMTPPDEHDDVRLMDYRPTTSSSSSASASASMAPAAASVFNTPPTEGGAAGCGFQQHQRHAGW